MNWKTTLRTLERDKQWDSAIEFMQQIIKDNPHDVDAYLFMNYLLMNLLVEENYDDTKHDYYAYLTKKYFDESYAKFSDNPEYLFYTAMTAAMSEWYFDIKPEDYEDMLKKAFELEPNNLLYQDIYYSQLDSSLPKNKQAIAAYAAKIIDVNSPIKDLLQSKGALGEYILEIMTNYWKKATSGVQPY